MPTRMDRKELRNEYQRVRLESMQERWYLHRWDQQLYLQMRSDRVSFFGQPKVGSGSGLELDWITNYIVHNYIVRCNLHSTSLKRSRETILLQRFYIHMILHTYVCRFYIFDPVIHDLWILILTLNFTSSVCVHKFFKASIS